MQATQVLWAPLNNGSPSPDNWQGAVYDRAIPRSPELNFNFDGVSDELREIIGLIGQTPLLELPSVRDGGRIFAKAEYLNPFGTIKARTALALIARDLAEDRQTALSDRHYLTYGGATFHYPVAVIARLMGAKCSLYSGTFLTAEQIKLVEEQGAELTLIDKERGFWEVVEQTIERSQRDPSLRFLYQHQDDANPLIHENSTGAEIVRQLENQDSPPRPAAFIASVGTGGTIIGVGKALKKAGIQAEMIAVSPAEQVFGHQGPQNGLPKIAGSGGMGFGRRQPFLDADPKAVSHHYSVAYQDAILGLHELSKYINLFVGTSAAANWLCAREYARRLSRDQCVITVIPSLALPSEVTLARRVSSMN